MTYPISPLFLEAEENRRQEDAQLASDWLEKFAQIQADLKVAAMKANSDELREVFRGLEIEILYFRDDHAAELKEFTE